MRFNRFIFILILLISTTFILSNLKIVFAQGSYNFATNSGLNKAGEKAGYNTSSGIPLTGYISQVITTLLSILGVIFLAFTIYGGIMWMTAAGNEEKVKKARELIIESIIGVAIVLVAYAISYFVLKATTATTINNQSPIENINPPQ
jgi:lysylphosphatidylglycerol synthetase-like protein (DUF2156 family)